MTSPSRLDCWHYADLGALDAVGSYAIELTSWELIPVALRRVFVDGRVSICSGWNPVEPVWNRMTRVERGLGMARCRRAPFCV